MQDGRGCGFGHRYGRAYSGGGSHVPGRGSWEDGGGNGRYYSDWCEYIDDLRPAAYESGIKPLEFEAMTVQQVAEYLEAYSRKRLDDFKEQAILLQGQAFQITSGIAQLLDKKAKFRGLDKIYPELFGKKKIDISTMTPEQIERATVNAWSVFLGI